MKSSSKKVETAWSFYDWANSSYPLVITTAIFPIFFRKITGNNVEVINGNEVEIINFFGFKLVNTALYSYTFSLSFLVVALLSPILSGIADYTGRKKLFLRVFCYIGSISCMGLYFFDPNHIELSMVLPFLASIGYWGSIVFYNAFLPEIAPPEEHDRISAKGFTFGYVGSVLLLIGCLVSIQVFGVSARWSFIAVGIWWIGFAHISLSNLPNESRVLKNLEDGVSIIGKGFLELQKVWTQLKEMIQLKRYLAAFFVYNMGVQTVMLMAILFADKEINWPIDPVTGEKNSSGLIISVIIIQLIASVGAYVMSTLSKRIGNLNVLKIVVGLWVLICVVAYYISEPFEFYLLAAMVGFVMGGIQSMSRSTYSKMLPETHDHASFFSFFDVCEKLAIVLGTFAFGYIEDITGSMRNSVLVIIVFFVIGFILLQRVPSKQKLSVQTTD